MGGEEREGREEGEGEGKRVRVKWRTWKGEEEHSIKHVLYICTCKHAHVPR